MRTETTEMQEMVEMEEMEPIKMREERVTREMQETVEVTRAIMALETTQAMKEMAVAGVMMPGQQEHVLIRASRSLKCRSCSGSIWLLRSVCIV